MFYVDLDNETIIDKSEVDKQGADAEDLDDEEAASESKHPVLMNQYPIC